MSEKRKPSNYEPLKKAQDKYDKKTQRLTIRFLEKDKELYDYVKKQDNVSNYIKRLIKKDMN